MGNLFVLHLFFIHTTIYLYQCETHGYLFYILGYCCCSANPVVSNPLQPHGQQHTRPLCPSPSPEVCPSSCPLHRWCHPVISSSDALFSFCPQSLGYYPILFYLSSCLSCSNAGSSELFLCPFDIFPSLCVLILPNFLALNDVPGSSCIFAIPDLESAVLKGALVPCVGYRY